MDGEIDYARLKFLKLQRNAVARMAALRTIKMNHDGKWTALLGGRMRGMWFEFHSMRAAVLAVHEYYNRAGMDILRRREREGQAQAQGFSVVRDWVWCELRQTIHEASDWCKAEHAPIAEQR